MTVAQLLRLSGEKIREKGWAKFVRQVPSYYGNDHPYPIGACCALGAIEYALWESKLLPERDYLEGSPLGCAARDELAKHVKLHGALVHSHPGQKVANWNNHDAKSADEVVATFAAAAACVEHTTQE